MARSLLGRWTSEALRGLGVTGFGGTWTRIAQCPNWQLREGRAGSRRVSCAAADMRKLARLKTLIMRRFLNVLHSARTSSLLTAEGDVFTGFVNRPLANS